MIAVKAISIKLGGKGMAGIRLYSKLYKCESLGLGVVRG
jgi:hypothetical protein